MTPRQADLFATTTSFCGGRVAEDSIYALLHRECFNLFPDEMFADLFCDVGRRSVPPMIVAVVMVLQRIEGCSDREAVDRFTYDARWKYAAGGLDFDYPGFVHTVLVEMRARLAGSEAPNRIFEVVLRTAKRAGLVGRRRVLDSTPLYDAVATMDTVTLIRSAIRGLLGACDADTEGELRGLIKRADDYATAGKPVCDYEDRAAREALIDALAADANAFLLALDGRELGAALAEAAALLAAVVGQDLDQGPDGVFRIARRVAKDRIISTVDPEARHGHKTSARGFDGYKGHVAVDPDCELITATAVGAGNAGDAAAASELIAEELGAAAEQPVPADQQAEKPAEPEQPADTTSPVSGKDNRTNLTEAERTDPGSGLAVFGDAAYGAGELLDTLEQAGAQINCKVQPPVAPGGRYPKDAFEIDLDAGTVSCPASHRAPLRAAGDGQIASFGAACVGCPLAAQCTTSKSGRTVWVGPYEEQLARARARQADPQWKAGYTATRPKVERKIGHLMRRRHGGRRARVRGRPKIAADFALLGAAVNLARLGVLGLAHQDGAWKASTA
jgi:hypothetical protein